MFSKPTSLLFFLVLIVANGFSQSNNTKQQIVQHLDKQTKEIDDLVHLEQKKIETLKEYRQSLISEVITGKIKVVE